MLLETARRYNHETECITFLKDFTYSKDDFHRAGLWRTLARGCTSRSGTGKTVFIKARCMGRALLSPGTLEEIRKKHPLLRLTHALCPGSSPGFLLWSKTFGLRMEWHAPVWGFPSSFSRTTLPSLGSSPSTIQQHPRILLV